MEKLSVLELAAVLVVKNGLKKKEAERFITTVFEVVKDTLKTDRTVKIKGLGTFKVTEVEPRESVNVNTGERVLIEGYEKVTFTPDTAMKELVNKPFSQFETVILNDGVDFDEVSGVELDNETEAEPEPLPVIEEELPAVEEVQPVVEENAPFTEDESPVSEVEMPLLEEENAVVSDEEVPVLDEEMPVSEDEQEVAVPILDVFDEPQEQEVETEIEEIVEENVPMPAYESVEAQEEVPNETTDDVAELTDDELEEDIEEASSTSKYLWIGLALVACVLSFGAGYMIGMRSDALAVEVLDPAPVPAKTVAVAVDTIKTDTAKVEIAASEAPAPKPVAQPANEAKPTPENPAKPEGAQKYEQMDARVRTGAYYIIGTAQEVKVKEGETLKRIAQRYLGPDMDCYIEVYNGLTASSPLTVGQTIKIPKLQLKKKKQQTTNQE